MIAVFARPNHPNYNNAEWRYHGYVVIFVKCRDEAEVKLVQHKLSVEGLPEPYGHNYEQGWYGGRMDLITVLPGNRLHDPKTGSYWSPVRPLSPKASIGDNRYAGFYEAADLLN